MNETSAYMNLRPSPWWKYSIVFLVSFLFWQTASFAQPANDECQGAITLANVNTWCSDPGEFSNIGSTPSGFGAPTCWPAVNNDVWFIFTAVATDVKILIKGNANNPGGTLNNPQAALYAGNCSGTINQLGCAVDAINQGVIETDEVGLIVGTPYYIRIQGAGGNIGSFQICINNFNPPVEPTSDCPTAAILCDKSPFSVNSTLSAGGDITEMDDATCFFNGSPTNIESRSTWFTWIADNNGTLEFTLTPLNPSDDLDFAVYELPNGVSNCTGKILLRCMASGDFVFPSRCMGPTGLRDGETDVSEPAGCLLANQSNFIAPLDMTAGTAYALVVNNFTASGNGFSIEFGGTGEFLGPQADFDIDPELDNQCDIDQVVFTDNSNFILGDITNYSWTFGSAAAPDTATGPGPHNVVYSTFGTKFIVLTIETDLGCVVTEIQEIFIEPCCDPNNTLTLNVSEQNDVICHGDSTGSFLVQGVSGSPFYQYSLDGMTFTPNNLFAGVPTGDYTIFVQDSKGCINEADVFIGEPPPILVNAGPDVSLALGEETTFNGSYGPVNFGDQIFWSGPVVSISCTDCLDPDVVAPGTTTYTLTVTDEFGCLDSDSLTVFVSTERPIYLPNVFSPNFDGINDRFTIYGNAGARIIREFRVYNRWGGLMWEAKDIPLNDESFGWDGMHKGQLMNTGVYTFYASVEFIDDVVVLYEGDIAIVR